MYGIRSKKRVEIPKEEGKNEQTEKVEVREEFDIRLKCTYIDTSNIKK